MTEQPKRIGPVGNLKTRVLHANGLVFQSDKHYSAYIFTGCGYYISDIENAINPDWPLYASMDWRRCKKCKWESGQ